VNYSNTGNNPGNPNAPGYHGGGSNNSGGYSNTGNNPGNPNAPGYHARSGQEKSFFEQLRDTANYQSSLLQKYLKNTNHILETFKSVNPELSDLDLPPGSSLAVM
jgi:hypothetical protein